MAAAFRDENRFLVHCLQEIDGMEPAVESAAVTPAAAPARVAPAARPVDIAKFGGMLAGIATVVRLAMSSPENFVLPANPVRLDWLTSAAAIVAAEGVSRIMSLVNGLSVVALYVLILAGVVMLVRRSTGKGAMVATLSALGTILLMVAVPQSGSAMDFRTAGNGKDQVIQVPAGEIVDDSLIAAGDTVIIDGTIKGDLIAFARQVTVHGTVEGNILTGAQSIDIQGTVGGSIIAGGNPVEITGKVAHNVLVIGGRMTLGKDAIVGGDFAAIGSDSHVNGTLARNFYAIGASADVAGSIGRNVFFRGATISILPSARVGGDLTSYVPRKEAVHVDAGATIAGKQTIELPKPAPNKYATFGFYFSQMLHVAAAFLTGMILLLLFPGLRRVNLNDAVSVLKSAGIGFLAVVAMPVAAFILLITLIGFPLAVVGFVGWLLGLYLAKIIIANFVGRTLFSSASDRLSSVALSLFVGLMLIFIVINIPYIGGLIHFLLVFIGFGALVMNVYGSFQAERGSGI